MHACRSLPAASTKIGGLISDGDNIADLGAISRQSAWPKTSSRSTQEAWFWLRVWSTCARICASPVFEHQETIHSGSRSAAVGGITTIACMPSTNPPIDDVALVHFIERRARETSLVKVHPIAAITRARKGEQLTEIGLLQEAGAVAFSDGLNTIMNANVLRRALSYGTIFDAMFIHHPKT